MALSGPITSAGTGPPNPLCFGDSHQAVPSQLAHPVTGEGNGLFFLPQRWGVMLFPLSLLGQSHLGQSLSQVYVGSKCSFLFSLELQVLPISTPFKWCESKKHTTAPVGTEKSNSCPDRSDKGRAFWSGVGSGAVALPRAPWAHGPARSLHRPQPHSLAPQGSLFQNVFSFANKHSLYFSVLL